MNQGQMKVMGVITGWMATVSIPEEVRAEFGGAIEYSQLSIH